MFHPKVPQGPVWLLLLRIHGDCQLSITARITVGRPVLFTLSLGKGNKQKKCKIKFLKCVAAALDHEVALNTDWTSYEKPDN